MHLHGKRPVFEEELVLLSEQLAVGSVTAKWKQKGFRENNILNISIHAGRC